MQKLLVCAAVLSASLTPLATAQTQNAQPQYATYKNARFGYSLQYPTFLAPQPEAQNGDGRRFLSRDGKTILTVFGRHNAFDRTLRAEHAKALADWRKDGAKVTYSRVGKGYFALSGYVGGNIFYEKTLMKRDQFHTFFYEYPRAQKKVMDAPVNRSFASFR